MTGSTENNGIFRVTVECLLYWEIEAHGHRMFSLIDLFPPYFIKLTKYTPKNSFKMRFFSMSRAKYVHFLIWKLPNKISTLDFLHNSRLHFYFKIYSLKDISNFCYSNQKLLLLVIKGRNQFAPISIFKMFQVRHCLYFLWF